jgi:hypothetical protein
MTTEEFISLAAGPVLVVLGDGLRLLVHIQPIEPAITRTSAAPSRDQSANRPSPTRFPREKCR